MHILVFGGTGACGRAFIPEALNAGHELTLYARSPSKFPDTTLSNSEVNIFQGQLDDVDGLKRALSTGAEVLISFLGPDPPSRGMAITQFYERLVPLLPDSTIRRCMVLSTASYQVPEDRSTLKWRFIITVIRLVGGTAYSEINGLSRAIAALSIDKINWTLFRVPIMTNGRPTSVRAGYLGSGADGLVISRSSLSIWVLSEMESDTWAGKAPALSNTGWLL